MRFFVRLQDRRTGERLATHPAAKRALACMHPTVVLHVMPQLERLTAELTLERPVSGVHGQMGDERRHVGETFATELTQHNIALVGGGRIPRGGGSGLRSDGGSKLELHWRGTIWGLKDLIERWSGPMGRKVR